MKQSISVKYLLFTAILLLSACGSSQQLPTGKMESTKCPELRPEMCTMDYNPVCGSLSEGSFKTYSNGCNACSDPIVTSYTQGECK